MASRPVWKGYLKLSLVSVPVKAFTAQKSDSGTIQLNQLHDECHSRIKYQKTCPIHGPVSNDEIVSGYQVAKDQYVTVTADELKAIRRTSDQSLDIDTFIADDELDDRYLTDRAYYLAPDGAVAQKPYSLIRQMLESEHLRAVAEVVLNGREQHVLLRPFRKLLMMTVLQHSDELKDLAPFEEEVNDPELTDQELRLTAQLMQGMTKKKFSFDEYTDPYRDRLNELIDAKIEGKKLVKTPDDDAPVVINLMDALKASLNHIPATKSVPKTTVRKKSSAQLKDRPGRAEAQSRKRKPSPLGTELSTPRKRKGRRKTG